MKKKPQSLELYVEAHKNLWEVMGDLALKGEFPIKRNILEELGYDPEKVTNLSFLCDYAYDYVPTPPSDIVPFRNWGGYEDCECNWCPLVFTKNTEPDEDEGLFEPCMQKDSPYSEYCKLYKQYRNGLLDMKDSEVIQHLHTVCLTIANLPMEKGVNGSQ